MSEQKGDWISVRISGEIRRQMEDCRASTGMSLSAQIRASLRFYLPRLQEIRQLLTALNSEAGGSLLPLEGGIE